MQICINAEEPTMQICNKYVGRALSYINPYYLLKITEKIAYGIMKRVILF